MHMDILQEPFCAEIYRENAVRDDRGHRYHLEWTPGLNPDRKNPFSVATLFGEKIKILVDFVKKKQVVLQIWEWIRLKWKLHHPKHCSKEQRRSAEGFITRNYNHSLQISIIALAKQDLFWHFLESSPIDFIFS